VRGEGRGSGEKSVFIDDSRLQGSRPGRVLCASSVLSVRDSSNTLLSCSGTKEDRSSCSVWSFRRSFRILKYFVLVHEQLREKKHHESEGGGDIDPRPTG